MRNQFRIAFLALALLACSCTSNAVSDSVYVPIRALQTEAYPSHVEFSWESSQGAVYDFYLAEGKKLKYISSQSSSPYLDWSPVPSDRALTYKYYVLPQGLNPKALDAGTLEGFAVEVEVPAKSDELLLDMTQKYTTRYFSTFAEPFSGCARERSNNTLGGDIITTGGTGFGIMALIAAQERGYISEAEAYDLYNRIVSFLEGAERFHGAWAHWYNATTRQVRPFSKYDDGGDLVETAFLVEGLITLRQYLKDKDAALASRIDRLVDGVEWDWYTKGSQDALYWHWSKNCGWKMNHRIKGFDECFITYFLAAGSRKHPVSKTVYENSYKNSDYYYNGKSYYGIELPLGMEYGGPLFFTHYSWLGLNPKNLHEGDINYFERNRAHALIHYNYAIDNPKGHKGYGADLWGFTSSDDALVGYTSHHPGTDADNGTVSPSAAISSIVYTPEESLQCLRHLYYDLGPAVFGPMGFYDSYNPSLVSGQQVVKSYLAIDQGPIAVMIENWRSSLLWDLFMSSPEAARGLEALDLKYTLTE